MIMLLFINPIYHKGSLSMNQKWNQIIYRFWSPVYDQLFNRGAFKVARTRVFSEEKEHIKGKVLLVGIGTGADLQFIDLKQANVTGIDLSDDMLKVARSKFGNDVKLTQMNAQQLEFSDGSFDYVIASLILSVVPDPQQAFNEMVRVTRKQGSILLFDKFAPDDKRQSLGKKVIVPIIRLLGTDIGRKFGDIYKPYANQLRLLEDSPVLLGNMYRKIKVSKL